MSIPVRLLSWGALVCLLSTALVAQPSRDLFAAYDTGGNWDIQRHDGPTLVQNPWATNSFRNGTSGSIIALDVAESVDGDVFALVRSSTGPGGEHIESFESPFLGAPFLPANGPPVVVFNAASADTVTDLKVDWSTPGSESLIIVGIDTTSNLRYIERLSLVGTSIARVSLPAVVGTPFVAVDQTTGSLFVADGAGQLTSLSAGFGTISTIALSPVIVASDIAFNPTISDSVIISGRNVALSAGTIRRFIPSTGATVNPAYSTGSSVPLSITLDDVGDIYFAIANPSGNIIRHWTLSSGLIATIGLAPSAQPRTAITWTGRSAVGTFGAVPGNDLGTNVTMRSVRVGDTTINYQVPAPVIPFTGFTYALGLAPQIPPITSFGSGGFILLDPNSLIFTLTIPNPTFPANSFTLGTLGASFNGTTLFSQFLAVDPGTGNLLTSNLSAFTVGARPLD